MNIFLKQTQHSIFLLKPCSPMSNMSSPPQLTSRNLRTSFSSLPREVRDEIYLAVLQTPSPPPPSPHDAGLRSPKYHCRHVIYLTAPPFRHACQDLLACNHQINAELQEVFARHDRPWLHDLDFKLDLMIKGYEMWPTWTLIPGPVSRIRDLEVEVRMFDGFCEDGLRCEHRRTEIFEVLLDLLHHFSFFGPHFVGDYPTRVRPHFETVTVIICCCGKLEGQRQEDTIEDQSPRSGFSTGHRLLKLVLRTGSTGVSQGDFWKVSQIRLTNYKEMEELSTKDSELALNIEDFWNKYKVYWTW